MSARRESDGGAFVTGLREQLESALLRARHRSHTLTDCVDDSDLIAQHSPLMSPLVWDLAHIGNQEELWLIRDVGGRDPVRRDIDELYDAFKHARSTRPTLPLLGPDEARKYVGEVRDKTWDVLDASRFRGRRLEHDGFAFAMIAQHEQQHDETMLATHQLRKGQAVLTAPDVPRAAAPIADRETVIPAGEFTMGTSDDPWALDNERPAHRVHVPEFAIDTVPVSNAEYAEFIDDGGYRRRELWSERGWQHNRESGLEAPQFWTGDGSGRWWRHRFGVLEPVPADEPVMHVCWFEADAYARWAGKRLPTESEWEKAARWHPASGRSRRFPWGDEEPDRTRANLGQRHLAPAPVGSYPAGRSPLGVLQLIGDVWEWTSSRFTGYPGFTAFPYREYSEVFFGGDYRVLRGGSFGTDPVACRGTFRNWDHPIRRQIFAGFRCARDV
ncbi:ergothioneine biosynthesis protein EgtB [Rhodococcus hoagii]|uniref:Hercynine oxygenase n=3 Tax=Rhodococcus hoagii TaxID=43767 RepID=A0A9Q5F2K4_RHOHA|nr:ergothioneine biosynthesis protein EgtB [Prescottella equi]MCD7049338.1 ergothioneine biosynthesis protein EgtB [Rhodococcus sp. BH2-1]MBM4486768.1 ergothioneine biosynthesis protein EgtB [Prescottella equi]MBM4496097.1 ergothioneine biosynthesis protein EgtB [Prescottella equi]MBM4500329.1 ergothioneine biosynthesis protein EgtB [Prescottella equi]MBM4508331.1 ergothioneine biosynthesis protein EgtB [Prescottella equi]